MASSHCRSVLLLGLTAGLTAVAGAHVPARAAVRSRAPSAAVRARGRGAAMSSEPGGPAGRLAMGTRRALLSAALLAPAAAWASGGATAGKFSSIPIAKRRYYGRVQEAVHEFVELDPAAGAEAPELFDTFFGTNILVRAGRTRTNCIGPESICTSKEAKTSRWDDMQLTMFLLGNAFRIDSSKAPERIKQVQMARKFFKEVELFKDAAAKSSEQKAKEHYQLARALLDDYLDQVDLPPSTYEVYKTPFNVAAKKLCAGGNFCI